MNKYSYFLIGMISLATQVCHGGTITFKAKWAGDPAEQRPVEYTNAIKKAKAFLESRITGTTSASDYEYVLSHKLLDIDDQYGILGYGGPTQLVNGTSVAFSGQMVLDRKDVAWMAERKVLTRVILHEWLHALGFGTFFDLKNEWQVPWEVKTLRVRDASGNYVYVGELGVERYNTWRTSAGLKPVSAVPLETEGGPGSVGSHWPERLFQNELMSSMTNSTKNPCSSITIAVLRDLGYVVKPGSGEPFTIQFPTERSFKGFIDDTDSSLALDDDGIPLNPEDTEKLKRILSKKMYCCPQQLTAEQKELFGIPADLSPFHDL